MRTRKTDTYRHGAGGWTLIAATEIFIADRPRGVVSTERLTRLIGTYVLGTTDSLAVLLDGPNQLVMVPGGATADTLVAETDSTFYQQGDRGTWVFSEGSGGRIDHLTYRASGQADVILRHLPGS